MRKISCKTHGTKFVIPSTNEEYLLANMHENIVKLQEHYEHSPTCKFEEADK